MNDQPVNLQPSGSRQSSNAHLPPIAPNQPSTLSPAITTHPLAQPIIPFKEVPSLIDGIDRPHHPRPVTLPPFQEQVPLRVPPGVLDDRKAQEDVLLAHLPRDVHLLPAVSHVLRRMPTGTQVQVPKGRYSEDAS